MKKYIIHTDGGARGNPGPAAIGCVVHDQDKNKKYTISRYIGNTTNNQAEYQALLAALEKAYELQAADVECFLDSELVVKQMRGEYRIRDKNLSPLYLKIWNLTLKFNSITFNHIPRSMNKEADTLVNQALDRELIRH